MKNFKEKIIIVFCILLFAGIFLAEDFLIKPKSRAVFCDVGQGDGAFINLKGGTQIIIDGGPDNKMIGCVGKYMPYFDRTIEYLIISHPDKDHFVGAVEILKRYNVEQIFVNGDNSNIPEYDEFLKLVKDKFMVVKKGDIINFTNGTIEFFYPIDLLGDSNDNSLIFKFLYGGKSILFTGDTSIKIEEKLLPLSSIWLKSDILKISHHGSKTSSSEIFLRAVNPNLAIISVGENKFGHPSYRVIKRLERLGIKYQRTDEEGDIIVTFDH